MNSKNQSALPLSQHLTHSLTHSLVPQLPTIEEKEYSALIA